MKKVMLFVGMLVTILGITGCASLYEKFQTTPEEVHKQAVAKVKDYVDNYVCNKIEKSDALTVEAKAKLKADVKKILAEVEIKLNELRAKYVEAKNAKKAEKEAKKAEAKEAVPATTEVKVEVTK